MGGQVQIALDVQFDRPPHRLLRSTGIAKQLADLFVGIPTAELAADDPANGPEGVPTPACCISTRLGTGAGRVVSNQCRQWSTTLTWILNVCGKLGSASLGKQALAHGRESWLWSWNGVAGGRRWPQEQYVAQGCGRPLLQKWPACQCWLLWRKQKTRRLCLVPWGHGVWHLFLPVHQQSQYIII